MICYGIVTDTKSFKKYICAQAHGIGLIRFEEQDRADIVVLAKISYASEHPEYGADDGMFGQLFTAICGENDIIYTIRLSDGKVVSENRYGLKKYLKTYANMVCRSDKIENTAAQIRKKYTSDTVVKSGASLFGWQASDFFDTEYGIRIPFRFRKSRTAEKRPLLVYLHGAGSIGQDNMLQLAEYATMNTGAKKSNFHVLVPQCGTYCVEDNIRNIDIYTRSLNKLVRRIVRDYAVDTENILISGVSYGGACVWYAIQNAPDLYSAAVPISGYMPEAFSDAFDTDKFAATRILACHAKDDGIVTPESTRNICSKLRESGCDIEYIEYEKGGHGVAGRFYRSGYWKELIREYPRQAPNTRSER